MTSTNPASRARETRANLLLRDVQVKDPSVCSRGVSIRHGRGSNSLAGSRSWGLINFVICLSPALEAARRSVRQAPASRRDSPIRSPPLGAFVHQRWKRIYWTVGRGRSPAGIVGKTEWRAARQRVPRTGGTKKLARRKDHLWRSLLTSCVVAQQGACLSLTRLLFHQSLLKSSWPSAALQQRLARGLVFTLR